MGNLLNGLMSSIAIALSVLTTYFSFFDDRATLTASIDEVRGSVQSGGGGGDGQWSYSFQYGVDVDLILSLTGTRPIVLTDASLVRSASPETCVESDHVETSYGFETTILEPGALRPLTVGFSLPRIEDEAETPEALSFEPTSALWCLRFTVFDQSGERRQPMMRAFAADITFFNEGGERYPSTRFGLDVSHEAIQIFARGSMF